MRFLYKTLAILLILFISIQYFYFYPLNLNTFRTSEQSTINSRLVNHIESLFYFKTNKHSDSGSSAAAFSSEIPDGYPPPEEYQLIQPKSKVNPRNTNSSEVDVVAISMHGLNATGSKILLNPNSSNYMNETLPLCPMPPPTLMGYLKVKLQAPTLKQIALLHPDLPLGGHYRPPTCRSRDRVAIIVPFRDREEHLRLFLYNLHPLLKRQMLEYNIFVIEQGGASKNDPFNRAMLFNVGFMEANKRATWDCFIFHDVDLLPENDHNLYNCPEQPRHMSVAVDKMNYQLPYKTLFGGISALRKEHFTRVNGFSNMFWGWGAEDDDMANRIAYRGLYISRPSPNVARYKMLKHKHQKLNTNRYKILHKGKQRFNSDGLSNLNYTVEQVVLEKLYTLVRVQLIRVGEG